MSIKRLSGNGIYGAKSIKLWDQYTTLNDFQSIATVVVPSGGTSTVNFSNIPQTYTHLQIRAVTRDDVVDTGLSSMSLTFSGVITGNQYVRHGVQGYTGDTSAASKYGYYVAAQNTLDVGANTDSQEAAGKFTVNIIDILDYTSITKNKVVKSFFGYDNGVNTYSNVSINSGLFLSTTTAVTSIQFTVNPTGNFVQNSQFSLYGIKVAS